MPKATETVLEINLKYLEQNYKYLKSKLQPKTMFLAVVKAFAYGSDQVQIAKKITELGADYLAVAYTSEGVAIRKAGIQTPILVLHPQEVNFEEIVAYNLEPSIYSDRVLNQFIAYASSINKQNYPIHLKFNTGLNRLGFLEVDIDQIIKKITETEAIKVASAFSHMAASEDLTEKEFTDQQIQCFKTISNTLDGLLGYSPIKHMCNTSGILNYPDAHFNMVRSGIGLYGFGNDVKYDVYLKPIASLKTVISQLHYLEPNQSVGYNMAYKVTNKMITATLPVGHADGIGRIYGNQKGFVFINGKKAPILGNTCMDMIMVNVTNIDCKEGDEVIVFNETYTADALATAAGTISYELVTGISQRVKRVFNF
ncbi:alanine racemase [Cellulophaga omnivescoria]|uniref:alanine racemase n=1 Tax=Cellulophaga omnivescoria TaxID=1888890 RepID=UPI000985AC39|nr:alanine racemase [Cellulophaga omnivescoria]WBU90526.1 alanine racemase [Cellulophaga omnivescoria]